MLKILDIVKEAGEILKKGYYKKKSIEFKGEVDLVTEFDKRIELFLKEKISKIYPGFQIAAEESFDNEKLADRVIFIDPIDGTTNFIHNIAYVAISVGIYEKGEPIEGVIYNPILNELFWAKKGIGAFLNGERIEVDKSKKLITSLISTGFPYTKVKKGKDFIWVIETMKNLLPKTRDIRRLGSASIDLAYVACGRFSGFYEVNLKPWDVAAGILLVKEAGGNITNHLGQKYNFGDIIVASNGKIHKDLIENMGKY